MRRSSPVVIAALSALAAVAFGTTGAGASPASVTGGGAGSLGGDRLQLHVSASGVGVEATGRFNVIHHTPGGLFARAVGRVDCLAVTGSSATVTGTVTQGFHSLGFELVDTRVALVIHDGEVDSFDVELSFLTGRPIAPCTAEPILSVVIDDGKFTVHG